MRFNLKSVLAVILFSTAYLTQAQNNSVAIGQATTVPEAVLLLVGNGSQGLIIPKVNSLGSFGQAAMVVYNTTDKKVYFHDGTIWNALGGSTGGGKTYTLTVNGSNQLVLSDGTTSTPINVPIAGDVTGTTLANTLVKSLNGKPLPANFSSGVLTSDVNGNLSWTTPSSSVPVLADGQILTGNGTANSATTLSGDGKLSAGALTVTGIQGKTIPSLPNAAVLQLLSYNGITNQWEFKDPTGTNIMVKSVYDPTGKAGDAFDLTKHSGVLSSTNGGTGLSTALGNGQILTGNGTTNSATLLSGDASLNGGALKISGIQGIAVSATTPTNNQVLQFNGTNWAPANLSSGGTVTSITGGTGLTGGVITNTGTLAVDVGTTANKIVQLDANAKLPAVDGSQLTNLPAAVESDPTVKAINGIVKSNGTTIGAVVSGTDIKTINSTSLLGSGNISVVATESDPSVKAISGIVKSNGTTISAAVAGTDYIATESDPAVKAINGLVKSNGTTIGAVVSGTDIKTINSTSLLGSGNITVVATESDPSVKAISGIVKSNGTTISAAVAGTDYVATETDPAVKAINGLVKSNGATIGAVVSGTDIKTINSTSLLGSGNIAVVATESDPTVKAINGLVKSNGTTISAAAAGTDYQAPITLTTTGTSGVATLVGNTLNVPNYAATSYLAGTGLSLTGNTFSVTSISTTEITDGTIALADLNPAAGILYNGSIPNSVGDLVGDFASGLTIQNNVATGGNIASVLNTNGAFNLATTGTLSTGAATVTGLTIGTSVWPANSSGSLTNDGTGNLTWVPSGGSGTVTSISAGTGLTGGPITTSGTLSVDVGTTANKIVQLDAAGKLPAIDGSQLTNLPAGVETDPTVKAINGLVKSNGTTISAAVAGTDYVATEADPAVKAINGLVKSNGITISAATAGTDYQAPITLTTTGTSGAATLAGNTLNIPQYSAGTTYTAGTGLTLTTNTFSVNTSQNISTLSNLTTKGVVTTTAAGALNSAQGTGLLKDNGTGTISYDNSTYLTANQSITLSGDVTGSGTTAITTAIGSGKVTNAMLAGSIASSKLVGTDINTVGTITTGIWNGTKLDEAHGGTNQTTYAIGDILYASASNTLSKLTIGPAGQVLTSGAGGIPTWTAASSGWGLTGNAGTTPATNFIGTTDAQDLVFKTNSVENLRVASGGKVGIGVTAPTAKLDINSSGATSGSNAFGINLSTLGGGAGGSTTYGVYSNAHANGGATSMGIYAFGQGGTTDNWAGYFDGNTAIAGGLAVGGTPSFGTAGQVLTSAGPGLAPTWSAAGGGWGLTGNAGTIDGTNFIGTTDNIPLNFKMNNLKAGRIDNVNASTFFGSLAGNINTGSQNAAFGSQAMEKNVGGGVNAAFGQLALNNNTTGGYNVAVGAISMSSNTTGSNNAAIGVQANNNNTTGSFNNAIGYNANYTNATSNNNVAVGHEALFSNTGGNNTGLGYRALYDNGNGANNTAVGYGANVSTGGLTNATAIGYNAKAGASNSLVLGGTGIDAVKVGIGNTAPSTELQIDASQPTLRLRSTTATSLSQSYVEFGHDDGAGGFTNAGSIGDTGAGDFMQIFSPDKIVLNTNFAFRFAILNTGAIGLGGTLDPGTTGQVLTSAGAGAPPTWTTISGSGWGLSGNAGTSPATNFIGTTDNVALEFKVNNQHAGKIDPNSSNQSLGYNAGGAITSGFQNSFFGATSGQAVTSGVNNTAFGYASLVSTTTATDNTAVGYASLNFNTGAGNTAVGSASSALTTTGGSNTSIGFVSLNGNKTGSNNTAIGVQALYSNNAGSNATAIGTNAMQYSNSTTAPFTNGNVAVGFESIRGNTNAALNTGFQNTAIGYQTLQNNSSGDYNTATGHQTLLTNSTGVNNTGNGYRALYFNTSNDNTAMGYSSLLNNSSGSSNTSVGSGSMQSNTTGSSNTAVGYNSLFLNVGGSSNTAVGFYSLRGNTTGVNNTASGHTALQSNTTGQGNAAFGSTALSSNIIGDANTATGYGALSNTTSSFNTAVGNVALQANTTGANNTATGYQALIANTTASGNTAFGSTTLSTNSTGTNNTALGFSALSSNTTGSSNTAIGALANVSSGALTNATAIGASSSVTTSNTIQLGNTAVTTVNVGVGTTAKLVTGGLQVTGGAGTAGQVLTSDAAGNATWQAAGAGSGWTTTGNGGTVDVTNFIGTTDLKPFNIRVNNLSSGRIDPTLNNTFFGYQTGNITATGSSNTGLGYFALTNLTGGIENVSIGYGTLKSNRDAGGNVAVGKSALFTINYTNGGVSHGTYNTAVGYEALYNTNATGLTDGYHNSAFGNFAGHTITTGTNNTFLGDAADASSGTLSNATAVGANAFVGANNSMVLGSINGVNGATANTKVGIGTTTPSATLEINGNTTNPLSVQVLESQGGDQVLTIQGRNVKLGDISGGGTGANLFIDGDATGTFQFLNGNVGIGTTTASSTLEVEGDVAGGAMMITSFASPTAVLSSASVTYTVFGTQAQTIVPVYIPNGITQLRAMVRMKATGAATTSNVRFAITDGTNTDYSTVASNITTIWTNSSELILTLSTVTTRGWLTLRVEGQGDGSNGPTIGNYSVYTVK